MTRKVVIVSPGFFHLDEELAEVFKDKKFDANLIIERPFGKIGKICIRFKIPLVTYAFRKFVVDKIEKNIDANCILVFVNPELLRPSDVQKILGKAFGGIVYLWDSIKVKPSHLLFYQEMPNRIITSDIKEAEKYKVRYLPLSFGSPIEVGDHITYDLSWFGTLYGKRIFELIRFEKRISEKGFHFFFLGYCRTFIQYIYCRVVLFFYRSKVQVTPTSISRNYGNQIVAESRAVLDIADNEQWSLSFRCIEAVKAGKKLISNNKAAIQENYQREKFLELNENLKSDELMAFIKSEYSNRQEDEFIYSQDEFVSVVLDTVVFNQDN